MEKRIKIGVFGLGRGMTFVEAVRDFFKEDAVIYAICDKKQHMIDNAMKDLPDSTLTFRDFDSFIDCGLDAVVLTNYFHEHARFAIRAMEKGIAVLTETIPAVTFKECAELCDTAERTGAKYSFGENYPFSASCLEMKRLYESGKLGEVGYAEGEYWHPSPAEEIRQLDPDLYHWRKYSNAGAYYCTHAMAPLMYMTGAEPVEINARTCCKPGFGESILRFADDRVTPMLVQMDNGAVFRVMGCALLSPHGNWYRLGCTKAGVETVRGQGDKVRLTYNEWDKPEGEETEQIYAPTWEENSDLAEKTGHGGGDFWVMYHFIEYLKGNEEPPFDVYKATRMSAMAIQAWRSVLNGGNSYPVPDFRDMAVRNAYRNDNLTPFADEFGNGQTLPCSSHPLSKEYLDNYVSIMKERFGESQN